MPLVVDAEVEVVGIVGAESEKDLSFVAKGEEAEFRANEGVVDFDGKGDIDGVGFGIEGVEVDAHGGVAGDGEEIVLLLDGGDEGEIVVGE